LRHSQSQSMKMRIQVLKMTVVKEDEKYSIKHSKEASERKEEKKRAKKEMKEGRKEAKKIPLLRDHQSDLKLKVRSD
ncbi:hypothetical protein ALC53_08640, partial [Atta colombica]